MYRFWQAIYKEYLLVKRDLGGLLILFIMPLVLVIMVTLIQDFSFNQIKENKIPILVVDLDQDELSRAIISNLNKSRSFEAVTEKDDKKIEENQVKALVLNGDYKLGVIIPENLTSSLTTKVTQNVDQILSEFGMEEEVESENRSKEKVISSQKIKLFFDPAAQISFRIGVKNTIEKMISKIETKSIYSIFQKKLETEKSLFDSSKLVSFEEINPKDSQGEKMIIPNSVQHNVPAWTLFAIFFIIIPLSINIVKEKSQGTYVRLKTNPTPLVILMGGKIMVYLFLCLLQFALMLIVGKYLFPYLGLPKFEISGSYGLLLITAICIGLAAIGCGILLGTVASTPEQSAPFGATFVVILAAIGGVWVPVFMMPESMQVISKISPMNWGLNAFHDVILRGGNLMSILPELSLLIFFFILMISISIKYDQYKNAL